MHRWVDDGHLIVGDTTFRLFGVRADAGDEHPWLFKTRESVEFYLRHRDELHGGRVFEAGILHGGSAAFLTALLEPERLAAIDITPERNAWLDDWLAGRGRSTSVTLHHGVDQSDRDAVGRVLDDAFGAAPLDLAIDDASHLLSPTTSTFNVVFPRVRPGGLFVIEDWSRHLVNYRTLVDNPDVLARALERRPDILARRLAERPDLLGRAIEQQPQLLTTAVADDAVRRDPADPGAGRAAEKRLWRLVHQLVQVAGAHPEVIPHIEIIQDLAAIRRGPAALDPATFDVHDWIVGTEHDRG